MIRVDKLGIAASLLTIGLLGVTLNPAAADVRIEGQVQAGGGPVANSAVSLWAATEGEPQQLAQAQTSKDGRFQLSSDQTPNADVSLYLVAKGGVAAINKNGTNNPAIALLTVLGRAAPTNVFINEMTTVASVWTNAQFLDGTTIKGPALGLKIAAGNVPSFVDLQLAGGAQPSRTRSTAAQTPTMANFATLADVLAGCATLVTADACDKLFIAATPPKGPAPTDTLNGGPVDCSLSLVSAQTRFRAA